MEKTCLTCKYLCLWEHDCVNIKSKYFSEYVQDENACNNWESEEKSCFKCKHYNYLTAKCKKEFSKFYDNLVTLDCFCEEWEEDKEDEAD